jgi:acyl carrier protein
MALTRDDVLRALRDQLGVDTSTLEDSTPLFSTGIIDSFSLVSLIMFVESEGGITVEPLDVNLENLDTIERILAYVGRKTAADAPR